MGLIVQRDKLVVSFFLNGKRVKEYTGLDATSANKKLLAEKLKRVTHLIKANAFDADAYASAFPNSPRLKTLFKLDSSDITVGAYLDQWHQRRCPLRPDGVSKPDHELHIRTWNHQGGTIALFKRTLGHHKLIELSPVHIKDLRAELELTRSGTTAVKILHVLSGALREAVEDRLIPKSPMPRLKRPSRKVLPRRKFTAEDRANILAALPQRLDLKDGTHVSNQTLHDLYSAWFILGWRDAEIAGLKFFDVDRSQQKINLVRTWSPRRNPVSGMLGYEDRPKTGEREVPLAWAPQILAIIERRRTSAEYLAAGRPAFVFHDSGGRAVNHEVLAMRVWAPILRDLGISTDETVSARTTAMYAIRHTAISTMVDANFPIQVIEQVTGTSRQRIYQNYLHVDVQLDANVGRRYLDEMSGNVSADVSSTKASSPTGRS